MGRRAAWTAIDQPIATWRRGRCRTSTTLALPGRPRPSGSEAFVAVVQSADFGQLHDLAHARRVDGARLRRVLAQRQMRP